MRLRDLYEEKQFQSATTPKRIQKTLPPTYLIPNLVNSNGYPQYRHGLAMATALAVENGDVDYDQQSMWNQTQTVICYTDAERRILDLANKLMGVDIVSVSDGKSHELDFVHKTSPVVQNRMFDPE